MKGNRLWLLASVASIVAIVVLGWFLGISPRLLEAATVASERNSVEQLNLIQETELATLREQQANTDELQEDLDRIRAAIPDEVLAEDFIDAIASAAISSRVILESISLAEPGNWGVAPTVEGAPTTTTEGVEAPPNATAPPGVYTVAVTLKVEGTPLDVIAFSRLAQQNQRLFFVETFTYVDEESEGTLGGFIFVYRDVALPPPGSEEPEPTPESSPTPEPTPTETPAP